MPATRSNSIQPRRHPFPSQSPPRKHHEPEVITLDLEQEPYSRVPLGTKRQSKLPGGPHKKASVYSPPMNEVIEISSDEEESPQASSQASIIADFRRQMSRMRDESMKHKKDFERASKALKEVQEENSKLQALKTSGSGKISLDFNQLADHMDCEICTGRMWTPYILPDCGHSFCQSCLTDWFGTIQAQFLAQNPDPHAMIQHNVNQLRYFVQNIASNPALVHHPHIPQMLSQVLPPTPNYTCPTCREPVRTRPTEAFALKALIGKISTVAGENSPEKPAAPSNRKGKAPGPKLGPWDGFFPPRKP